MQRIDHPTAVDQQPVAQTTGEPGFFSGGDPMRGTDATWMTPDWANDVQENICQAIEAVGIELVKGDGTQLREAIRALSTQFGLPIGVPVPFIGSQSAIPSNCVPLMGQTVSRATYPDLAAYALGSGVIVDDASWLAQAGNRTKFSTGDGEATIRLPDLRGEAIYGADLGRGVRTAAIGDWLDGDTKAHGHTATAQAVPNHVHTGTTSAAPAHNHGGATGAGGAHDHNYQVPPPATDPDGQGAASGVSWLDLTQYTTSQTSAVPDHTHPISADGAHTHTFTSDAAGGHTPVVTIGSTGGAETRQRGTNYPFIMRIL